MGVTCKAFDDRLRVEVASNVIAPGQVQIPSPVTYGDLRLNPMWDPIRADPRFEALLTALAPGKK